MSSRLMRALLKLYPRRIRKRYGDELLDLQSELAAKGDLSRTRLIRDVFAGALLVRSSRQRAHVVIGAVLLMVGLAIAVTIISAPGTNPPARASHPELRLAVKSPTAIPCGSCSATSSSSSLTLTCASIGQPANTVAPSGTSSTQSGPSCQPASTGSAVSISTTTPSGRSTTALPTAAVSISTTTPSGRSTTALPTAAVSISTTTPSNRSTTALPTAAVSISTTTPSSRSTTALPTAAVSISTTTPSSRSTTAPADSASELKGSNGRG
jgi:hypothetical protein